MCRFSLLYSFCSFSLLSCQSAWGMRLPNWNETPRTLSPSLLCEGAFGTLTHPRIILQKLSLYVYAKLYQAYSAQGLKNSLLQSSSLPFLQQKVDVGEFWKYHVKQDPKFSSGSLSTYKESLYKQACHRCMGSKPLAGWESLFCELRLYLLLGLLACHCMESPILATRSLCHRACL